MSSALMGAIEAGGTKFVCCVGRDGEEPVAAERIATTSPGETLDNVVAFFRRAAAVHGPCASFGIAAFGPLDLDERSPTWGRLTNTPKPGWSAVDLVSPLRDAFGVPVAIDTDVNGAGMAEARAAAARGVRSLVYVTVGTGIGGGTIVDGIPLPGASHPEMGHIRVVRHRDDQSFAGICPFHGDCLEGLASGPAINARWGRPAEQIDPGAWDVAGFYVAQLAVSVTMILAPDLIVLGGGLAENASLLPAVRRWTRSLLGGYPKTPRIDGDLEDYIVPPALGTRAGVLGALMLARRAAEKSRRA